MTKENGRHTYYEFDDRVSQFLGFWSDCRRRFYPLLMIGGVYGYGGNAVFETAEYFKVREEWLVGKNPILEVYPSTATDAEVQQMYQEREAISPVAVTNRHLVPW